ncbi:uncharacterized protein N0V89_001855 [Didymosphaeria variabile]|uniref:Uncharacterized protein n=1 Tax=Didymosphaeria variabile TaxID=1932322 RepID=A0A9W8XQL7_9PLEO|nr:uncharacterized protein N0V89_001855 [Didymosphaeria variabile]KAJ4357280.1 hypothetical protein N0V89_001855 [Didymosphaeria variabile]
MRASTRRRSTYGPPVVVSPISGPDVNNGWLPAKVEGTGPRFTSGPTEDIGGGKIGGLLGRDNNGGETGLGPNPGATDEVGNCPFKADNNELGLTKESGKPPPMADKAELTSRRGLDSELGNDAPTADNNEFKSSRG